MKYLGWKLIGIAIVLFSCSGGKKLMNKNLAYIYYNDPTIIHPDYRIYHESDSISVLYFRLDSKEALYSKKPKDSVYSAELSMHYRLYDVENPKNILDSATLELTDFKSKEQRRYLSGKLPFKASLGADYFLELTLNDKIRDQAVQNYQLVSKKDRFNRQNFLILDGKGKFSFHNYFTRGETITIKARFIG